MGVCMLFGHHILFMVRPRSGKVVNLLSGKGRALWARPKGRALWARPQGLGPLGPAQRAGPFGPGPKGRAFWAWPNGPGPLGCTLLHLATSILQWSHTFVYT